MCKVLSRIDILTYLIMLCSNKSQVYSNVRIQACLTPILCSQTLLGGGT